MLLPLDLPPPSIGFGVMSPKSQNSWQIMLATKLFDNYAVQYYCVGMYEEEGEQKKPLMGLILVLEADLHMYIYIGGYFLSVCVSLSLHDTISIHSTLRNFQ